MNIRAITGKTIAAVALSGALAGLGAGVAEAKPMERDHAKYCARVIGEYEYSAKVYNDRYNKWGPHNALTIQAGQRYDRAANNYVSSGC